MRLEKKKVIQEIETHLTEELVLATAEARVELERLLVVYRFLPRREYGAEEPIAPGSLVELELSGVRTYCFITPQGGGLVTRVDGVPVQVVTPQSPLGEALLGRKLGDVVQVELRGGARSYSVVGTS